jgi:hypothetical protein
LPFIKNRYSCNKEFRAASITVFNVSKITVQLSLAVEAPIMIEGIGIK